VLALVFRMGSDRGSPLGAQPLPLQLASAAAYLALAWLAPTCWLEPASSSAGPDSPRTAARRSAKAIRQTGARPGPPMGLGVGADLAVHRPGLSLTAWLPPWRSPIALGCMLGGLIGVIRSAHR